MIGGTDTTTRTNTFDSTWKMGQELFNSLSKLLKQRSAPKTPKATPGLTYSGNSGSIFGIAGNALKVAFTSFASFFSTFLGNVEEPSIKDNIDKMNGVAEAMKQPGISITDIGIGLANSFLPGFDLRSANPAQAKDLAKNMLSPTCSTPYKPTKK